MKRQAGFSLVDVMCAILILGIGLVGLTQGVTTALKSSKEAERQTTAALIAAGRIETLRAEGYLTNGEEQGEAGEGLSLYRWKQSVTSTAIEGLHEVQVTVENSQSGQVIYELKTLMFDPPLLSTTDTSNSRRDSATSRRRDRRRQ